MDDDGSIGKVLYLGTSIRGRDSDCFILTDQGSHIECLAGELSITPGYNAYVLIPHQVRHIQSCLHILIAS